MTARRRGRFASIRLPARIGLGSGALLLLVTMITVNVVGVWQIAITRRGVREERENLLRVEADAVAQMTDRTLAGVRADLAFVADSSALGELGPDRPRPRDLDDEGSLGAAAQLLLLFLRGHPEVDRVEVVTRGGSVAFIAGRARDIAGLWIPSEEEGPGPAVPGQATAALALTLPVPGDADGHGPSHRLRAVLAPERLAGAWEGGAASAHLLCRLDDAAGNEIVTAGGNDRAEGPVLVAVDADGWAGAPWRLACRFGPTREATLLEPVLSRYRTTFVLDLVMLGLAIVLGGLALFEGRRRRSTEARAAVDAAAREYERALFHAERLSTVGKLAAGVAHEINNPLEGMSNYLRLAEDSIERGNPAGARDHLRSVRDGLEAVAGIARGVLDHSRPQADSSGDAIVGDVITRATDFVRSRPAFAGIRFDLDLDDDGARVAVDPVALGQVVLNLLLNACEVQHGSGRVLVSSYREAADVVVEVADRGPGLRHDYREWLFHPFTSSKDSSGLGLFICSEIVRQHAGRIEGRNRPQGGALFRVRLPLLAGPEPSRGELT